jgi:hypothetical protein
LGDFEKAIEWQSKALRIMIDHNESRVAYSTQLVGSYVQHQPRRHPRRDSAIVPAEARRRGMNE